MLNRQPAWLILAVLLVAGCGGNADEVETPPSPSPTEAAASPDEPSSPSPTPSPTEDATVVRIMVANGEIEGGLARPEVELGETVRLEVTSDAADHVHVHGYDLFEDVEAGGTAVLEFTADIPGKFEIELEDQHFQIAELTVRG